MSVLISIHRKLRRYFQFFQPSRETEKKLYAHAELHSYSLRHTKWEKKENKRIHMHSADVQ